MSGPIVRKYGFPNFEKIFGERGLQHGAEESDNTADAGTDSAAATDANEKPTTPKAAPKARKKKT